MADIKDLRAKQAARFESRLQDLEAGYVELLSNQQMIARKIDDLYGKTDDLLHALAEQNLRTLFLLTRTRFKIKRNAGLILGNVLPTQEVTGLQFYEIDKENFLREVHAELDAAKAEAEAREAQEEPTNGEAAPIDGEPGPTDPPGDAPPVPEDAGRAPRLSADTVARESRAGFRDVNTK